MTLMILGNGESRLKHKEMIRNHDDDVWVCNHAFEEHADIPRMSAVATVHAGVARKALKYRKAHGLNYVVMYSKMGKTIPGVLPFLHLEPRNKLVFNMGSGLLAIQHAYLSGHVKILVAGFDKGGPCAVKESVSQAEGSFQVQWDRLFQVYPEIEIEFIQ